MKTQVIREKFLSFFKQHGHERVAGASLVPQDDPTLLFVNAGMVQFKAAFLGQSEPIAPRVTSAQPCVRAGGKHNDLDNVGFTARHHTFFEMLGNFSFGDYFKVQAIEFAWDFLTKELGISSEKLWVTVHDSDDEAATIWRDHIGVDAARITRCGDADNFWSMGDTGPCGPCTEIFYDHGPSVAGGPPGSADQEGDRYVEIWNCVFMQYNRDQHGELSPLPKPSVDTGMGLERIAAVMQGVQSNYDIDMFQHLINSAADILAYDQRQHHGLKVIADHCRSACFLIADGVNPSNEGRGYVLRRIIRRALRYGHQLSGRTDFLDQMVPALVECMGEAYPKLAQRQQVIEAALQQEQQQFGLTLSKGMKLLQRAMDDAQGQVLSGEVAFQLYDTYGFPFDLTQAIVREAKMQVDESAFTQAMQQQKQRSKQASQFSVGQIQQRADLGQSEFMGEFDLQASSTIRSMFVDDQPAEVASVGQKVVMILPKTPFYPEGGGQVGDQGIIRTDSGCVEVQDTQRCGDAIMHCGVVSEGRMVLSQQAELTVTGARQQIASHHTATHLLHAVLQQIFGDTCQQKGSLVDADKLRFDFAHDRALSATERHTIEARVNQMIQQNLPVARQHMTLDEAKAAGAMALFGEKYGDKVRVIRMGDSSACASIELCGGCHVRATGELGLFKLMSEEAVAKGVRRIEACVGMSCWHWLSQRLEILESLAQQANVSETQLTAQWQAKQQQLQQRGQECQVAQSHWVKHQLVQAREAASSHPSAVVVSVSAIDKAALMRVLDELVHQDQTPRAWLVLYPHQQELAVIAKVCHGADLHAGKWLQAALASVGARGGGRSDQAQGGGVATHAAQKVVDAALQYVNVHWGCGD